MKTSAIGVDDLLSVLTVEEVEKRITQVAGVESATVNYAAKNATVRYDETLLELADIKVLVHQRGQQPSGDSEAKYGKDEKAEHKSEESTAVKTMTEATPTSAMSPEPAAPEPAGDAQQDKADQAAPPAVQ